MNHQPTATDLERSDNTNEPAAGHAVNTDAYDWCRIEAKWQSTWRARDAFKLPKLRDDASGKYVFAACPFTSGSAHLGHIRSYTIADAYARFLRARGETVLFSMGFDSFGLPSELGALKNHMHPREWVDLCCNAMRAQFDEMGFSFDWERVFVSSDEDLYQWSQWLFVTLMERGLVYKSAATVDWCDSCQTVLARSQVEDDRCWRCDGAVRLVSKEQWFVRASAYFHENDRLVEGLTGWDKNALGSQRAALGRVDGIELDAITIDGRSLVVFLADADADADARESAAFVAMSPNHPSIDDWVDDGVMRERIAGLRTGSFTRSEYKPEQIAIVETDVQLIVPGVPSMLPLIVSPYVDARFGASAALGVPDDDAIAQAIAARLAPKASKLAVQSGAQPAEVRPAVRFSAADFPISRQRGWGAPVPLVHCESCGTVPVPCELLPVMLPDDLDFTGHGNPLVTHAEFVRCDCPTCGRPSRRETDTLDCHVDGVWHWMALCVPAKDRSEAMFAHRECERWLPAHQIVWGMDGGSYLLSWRMLTKMLRDDGIFTHVPNGEPFERVLMHGMVEHEGRKMSKHLGNVIDPQDLVARVGADTVRLAILHGAAPRNGMNWSEREVAFSHRFLQRLWQYSSERCEMLELAGSGDGIDCSDGLRRRLARWCDVAVEKITAEMNDMQAHRAARNLIRLLTRIEDFEQRALGERGELEDADRESIGVAILLLVQMLAPIAPHVAEELWALSGSNLLVGEVPWPTSVGPSPVRVADDARRAARPERLH